jgi:hypothetical protein
VVERNLAKVEVASSTLVSRSIFFSGLLSGRFYGKTSAYFFSGCPPHRNNCPAGVRRQSFAPIRQRESGCREFAGSVHRHRHLQHNAHQGRHHRQHHLVHRLQHRHLRRRYSYAGIGDQRIGSVPAWFYRNRDRPGRTGRTPSGPRRWIAAEPLRDGAVHLSMMLLSG